ncbi:MAG: cob(I)yrinic acid a,c-diamide adenosyltransferase [bacterium]
MKKGIIQIYTGNGKGKTTASVGLAVRARAHGLRVFYIQLFKDPLFHAGETKLFKKLGIGYKNFVKKHPCYLSNYNLNNIIKEVSKSINYLSKLLSSNKYDLIVFDEVNIALRDKLLSLDKLKHVLKDKPKGVEVVLTGRSAPRELIKLADLVTGMKELKHPFKSGLLCRKGIEY